jgi:DNA-binding MarR family transcriptional regulator
LVDNINIIPNLVDNINHIPMNARAISRQQEVLESLMSLFGGIKRAMRHELGSGVPPMLLRVLQLCGRQAGITQQGLARLTGRDKGQVARMVKELLELDLLQREDHPEDRRSHCLRPTSAGLAAVRRFEQAEAALAQWLLDGMTPTELGALQRQLGSLQQRIDEHLRQDAEG